LSFYVAVETEGANADDPVHLFLKGDEGELRKIVEQMGGHSKYTFHDYLAVTLPVGQVAALNGFPEVEAVHFEWNKGQPLLTNSLINTRVNLVHQGVQLPQAYTGEGVIVGVIDAGIDFHHDDFKTADGKTRVIEIWDQTMAYDATKTPSYGYGQVWDSAEINAGICPHQDQAAYFGHGTNTCGIATGNGMATGVFKGVAPDAELIVVASNFNSFSWTNTVADAVDYIFERAEAIGKPCVINASLGTYLGSHDGHDLAAEFIDQKIEESPGRAMVCAAGNSGDQTPYHLGYEASADTNFTWFKTASNATIGLGSIFIELYGSRDDFERVQFSIGADRTTPTYKFTGAVAFDSVINRLDTFYTEDLVSVNGNYLGNIQTWADSAFGTYRLQIYVNAIDSVQYNYRLSITGSGRFDLWSGTFLGSAAMVQTNLPSISAFPPIGKYMIPDIKQSIVSSWACSDKVITVGNYTNRTTYVDVDGNVVTLTGQTTGAIAATSSLGPSRLGSVKPEIVAPGDNTLAPGAQFQIANQLANISQRSRVAIGGKHNRAGGTSSASPVVAGIAALFFEQCPQADWADFKEALTASAVADQFTGAVPNDQWGHGKVDALNTLKYHVPHPSLSSLDNEFCEGDSLELTLNGSFPSIDWNTGETTQSITVDESGIYFVRVNSEKGCLGFSDTLSVFERPLPDKPVITVNGDNPACIGEPVTLLIPDEEGAYAWSNGAHTQSIVVDEAGDYFCVVSTIFHCEAHSDTVGISFYPGHLSPELYFQDGGLLMLSLLDSTPVVSYRWYQNGTLVADAVDSTYNPLTPGYYQGSYMDENGCEWKSNELNVYALGTGDISMNTWRIYPTPFDQYITLATNGENCRWQLRNMLGQVVASGNTGTGASNIATETLAPGTYTLTMYNDHHTMAKVLVKQ